MDRTDATSQSGRAILMDEKDATSEGGRTVVMDQVDATSETSSATSETMERNKDVDNGNDNGVAAGNDIADVRLFNDIHFAPTAPSPTDHVWAPFPQLPTELRLHIWLLFLRRHRMIEVGIRPDEDEDGTAYPGEIPSMSRFYARHNHLGKRVSGRGYTLVLKGGQGFATALNPLLWVNSEARQMALGFYRVHLPFPGRDGDQLLYLNPEYDVLHAWPAYVYRTYTDDTPIAPMPSAATLLVDLLCDLRAYDPKDRGCVPPLLVTPYLACVLTEIDIGSPISLCVRNTAIFCSKTTRTTGEKTGTKTTKRLCSPRRWSTRSQRHPLPASCVVGYAQSSASSTSGTK